jgi:hypothetical protein
MLLRAQVKHILCAEPQPGLRQCLAQWCQVVQAADEDAAMHRVAGKPRRPLPSRGQNHGREVGPGGTARHHDRARRRAARAPVPMQPRDGTPALRHHSAQAGRRREAVVDRRHRHTLRDEVGGHEDGVGSGQGAPVTAVDEQQQRCFRVTGYREEVQPLVRRRSIRHVPLAGQQFVHGRGRFAVGAQLGVDVVHGGPGVVRALQRILAKRAPVRHPGFP